MQNIRLPFGWNTGLRKYCVNMTCLHILSFSLFSFPALAIVETSSPTFAYTIQPYQPITYTSAEASCNALALLYGMTPRHYSRTTPQGNQLICELTQTINASYSRVWSNYLIELQYSCTADTANPWIFNATTKMCERNQQENLVISLQGGGTIEPGQSTRFTITVENQLDHQPPKNPVTVNIRLKVDATSGGHEHGNSTRPRGSIDNTPCESDATCKTVTLPAGRTSATFDFNATDASGTHIVTASCDKCTNGEQPADVTVKVAGLWPIFKAPTLYAFVGGESDKQHHDNHFLTSNAANQLNVIAINYHFRYPNDPKLYLNDASLKWGGKFDIKGNWKGDHRGHKRGTVIDIRANSINEGTSSIPERLFAKFEKMASETKKTLPGGEVSANAKLHCSLGRDPAVDNCVGDDNRHYHVILLGVDQ